MFHVYHSNRLERLLDRLVEVSAAPLADVLAPEVIVAQNQGMARWLSLRLAQRRGVAANLEFPLPAAFAWQVFQAQLDDVPERSSFDKESLLWRIMACLPRLLERPAFEEVARYVAQDEAQARQFQLCGRIADVLDQYLVYRPDLINRWEAGEEQHWQAQLWRAMVQGSAADHRARLWGRFVDRCAAGRLSGAGLPPRLLVFGIAALAPAYLEVLARIAEVIDVHLFVLNPCLSYWGDIIDEQALARRRLLWRRQGRPEAADYYTVGNPLLASLGQMGRDYLDQLHEYPCDDHDLFAPPQRVDLLGCLQLDILMLQERGAPNNPPVLPLAADDCSLQIHSCHSPMREVQVLHDQLLALFERLPGLTPQEVVVMAPDIDAYAPYIDAVFGAAPRERRIPWSVADRAPNAEHPIVHVFLELLGLPASRLAASEVLSWLEVPAVMRRYGLEGEGIERIRTWVGESGIRWGVDAAQRKGLGLPQSDENSWRFGLRRLLLGYAMPPEEVPFQGILPYPHVEGAQAAYLGSLHSFIDALQMWRERLAQRHAPRDWQGLLNALLDAFFAPDEEEMAPLQQVRGVLADLSYHAELAGFAQALDLEVVRDYLSGKLAEPAAGQRFLTGQVTFCTLVPMRSIPFRVVCLIGMNDEDYPRQQRPASFDLVAQAPRRGDRSRREDDRYLFLEALLSARDVLYLSYVGNSLRDNSPMLPSVVVSELLDYIEQGFTLEAGPIREHLVVRHPLQPFSARYFDGHPGLFSYAAEWLAGAQALARGAAPLAPFIATPLPEPEPVLRGVELDTLLRFFRNPARYFLRERLGVWLEETEEALADAESFALDALDGYRIKQEGLQWALEAHPLEDHRALLEGRGVLPHGAFGVAEYRRLTDAIPAFAQDLAARLANRLDPIEVDLAVDGFPLRGWLHPVTPDGLVRYRNAKVKAQDWIGLWLQHLVLNAAAPAQCSPRSVHLGEDRSLALPAVPDAMAHLGDLLDAYRQGLRAPLPFYPATSLAYAQALARDKGPQEAMKAARRVWEGDDHRTGEGDDSDYRVAFRGTEPLGEAFQALAQSLLLPLCRLSASGEP